MLRQGRQLTSYDGQSITYDAIGNPTNYMGADMTWFARQMQSYSKNGTNITYTYDADGLRTQKVVGGIKHEYYYVDGQLRYEKNGDSYEMYYNYDIDGRPVRAYKKDLVTGTNYSYYLITNTRGDVIETRDGNGNVNAKYTYDSWGKLISVTDARGNELASDSFAHQISLRYRGYVYDTETGLYYLQSRYYDPETGRFLNADSVDYIGYSDSVISYNMFAYCENEPVCRVDIVGNLSTRVNIRIIGYYIYIYKYKYLKTGHVDFSINGIIYSFGSNGASLASKIKGTADGYLSVNSVRNWHNSMDCIGTIRIGLTYMEYYTLIITIKSFMSICVSSIDLNANNPNLKTKLYQIISGKFSNYSLFKNNCATFVRDIVFGALPDLFVSNNLIYYTLITPAQVYSYAKKVGTEI